MGPEFQSITHPMGLMYIGATLIAAGHEPRLLDCAAAPSDFLAPVRLMQTWEPDCVGLSIIVSELEQAAGIIAAIRQARPGIPVILGGPWPSANPAEALSLMQADYVVAGEGEFTFPPLVDAIAAGRGFNWIVENLAGVVARSGDTIMTSPPAAVPAIDSIPMPAWDLLDHRLYAETPSMAGVGCRPYMTVVTSRGCPFRCAYCHQTQGKRFRCRSAESVLAEFRILRQDYGFREFEIVDDCFNLDRERMRAILTGIRDTIPDARLHFPNGVRSDHLDDDDVKLMRQAGTVSACFAIETASPELQKLIRKNLDIDRALTTIRAAVHEGIYSTGFFMLGLPSETAAQARATVDFAARSPLHRAIFMLTTPFAGTELAEMAREILGRPVEPHGIGNLNYFTSSVNISGMSDQELHRVFRGAYRRFYMNPARVVRVLLHHPRKWSLPRYAFMTMAKILPGGRRVRQIS
jgi:radical SAM superfamily enzyme YgiQ (UPF0313 family)